MAPDGPDRARDEFSPWRFRWALLTTASTLCLIFVGGLVTSTGSGLSVPDWPLSYGQLMPPMIGGVRYEHSHRLVATGVGLLTLILALWTSLRDSRAWVRRLAWTALATVAAQGILGGLTVLFLLPPPISVAHACLAPGFFCLLITLTYWTCPPWVRAPLDGEDRGVRNAALLATVCVFVQIALGAVTRHMGAGLAIPDFPLAFGRLIPPMNSMPVLVHFAHRAFAVVVVIVVLRLVVSSRRSGDLGLVGLGGLSLVLLVIQITLGAVTVLSRRSVVPTTAHVATGAALLGACWLLTLHAHVRSRRAAPATVPVALLNPVGS